MNVEVLISTMNQNDYSLLERMNIQTDAIVINQCNRNEIEEFVFRSHKIKWISINEKGVGLSRNTALMRATGDILLFADDDVVYREGYEKTIVDEYNNNSSDVIVFNVVSLNPDRPSYIDKSNHTLHWYNSLKYGAYRISIRKQSAYKNNLFFSLLYGGGTLHKAGEDNLFIIEALHKRLKVVASKEQIGTVEQRESTWFNGYDEKYYYDRGYLFANMFGYKTIALLTLFNIKNVREDDKYSFTEKMKLQLRGVKDFNNG